MATNLYVALSAQLALEKRMDTIADNVANMNTVGFRATGVKFQDLVVGTGQSAVDYASSGYNFLSTDAGALEQTGNPFDFAVKGDAWFAIQTPAGTVLTRDGRFTMLETGELVTSQGYPVLDAGGAPVQLNPTAGPPQAGTDGSLRQNGQATGALGLFAYTPDATTRRFGNSGVLPATPAQPVVDRNDVGVAQGFIEQSNVNPTLEMSHLITVQRNFDSVATLIRDSESKQDDAVKTLGSKSG